LTPDIFFEIDTYWVKVAGQNPPEIVKKFGKRAPLLHIKDGPAKWNDSLPDDNPDPMVAGRKRNTGFSCHCKGSKWKYRMDDC
jgi:sugar phosphate isomerase/epimerase